VKIGKPKKTQKSAPPASGAGAAQRSVLRDVSRHLMNTYKRSEHGHSRMGVAAYVFDQSGKKYLDFLGGIAVKRFGVFVSGPGAHDPP